MGDLCAHGRQSSDRARHAHRAAQRHGSVHAPSRRWLSRWHWHNYVWLPEPHAALAGLRVFDDSGGRLDLVRFPGPDQHVGLHDEFVSTPTDSRAGLRQYLR